MLNLPYGLSLEEAERVCKLEDSCESLISDSIRHGLSLREMVDSRNYVYEDPSLTNPLARAIFMFRKESPDGQVRGAFF
jgi:hypothetical protein